MEQLICNLCAGSPEIELYHIYLSEQEKTYLNKNHNIIKVDLCIGKEVELLIRNNIKTKGCCCGHGEYYPVCLVDKSEKEKLDKLKYEYKNYRDTNMYEIILKTDVQLELRKVLSSKIFKYIEKTM